LSDVSEQQTGVQMAAAAVSNVVNHEIVERKSRHLQPAKDASGLHVCKQITLPQPAPTPFIIFFYSIFRCLLPSFVPLLSNSCIVIAIKFIAILF
jgi:hypothetical protein